MFAKWLEECQRLFQKTRFISQLAAFLISIFALLSLYDLARFFNENPKYLKEFIEESGLLSSISFQVSILIVFASKFVLLFFRTTKTFWLNQVLCLVGLILLASYWVFSKPTSGSFQIYSTYTIIFRHASRSLELYGLYYLLFSPVRQFITLIYSLIKVRWSKI